jgi:hypothetical protein
MTDDSVTKHALCLDHQQYVVKGKFTITMTRGCQGQRKCTPVLRLVVFGGSQGRRAR